MCLGVSLPFLNNALASGMRVMCLVTTTGGSDMMPTTRLGQWAWRLFMVSGMLWVGNFVLEAWARMPVSTLTTKLLVMIVYAYFTLTLAIISGIMAVVAKYRHHDTSIVIWIPVGVAVLLFGAVVRSLWSP